MIIVILLHHLVYSIVCSTYATETTWKGNKSNSNLIYIYNESLHQQIVYDDNSYSTSDTYCNCLSTTVYEYKMNMN